MCSTLVNEGAALRLFFRVEGFKFGPHHLLLRGPAINSIDTNQDWEVSEIIGEDIIRGV